MINRIELSSSFSNAPAIPLSNSFLPNTDPVQIRNIEGLGPVKAEVEATPFATGRGELYQGSSSGKRNIVMTLGLNPNWIDQTMASLRQLLYRYLMVESWATLRFFTDELPVVRISGIVESFEPNLFSEDPEIQVSILCPKPDFIDVDATFIRGTIGDGIEHIDYEGTAPAGFALRVMSSPALPSYVGFVDVLNEVAGVHQNFRVNSITINTSFLLELNTVRGDRYVYSRPTIALDTALNILANMVSFSVWPELLPGENLFTVDAGSDGQKWTLAYFNRFGGL